jgi:hypothetical protein
MRNILVLLDSSTWYDYGLPVEPDGPDLFILQVVDVRYQHFQQLALLV